jgi:predicted phosphohydrolase
MVSSKLKTISEGGEMTQTLYAHMNKKKKPFQALSCINNIDYCDVLKVDVCRHRY